MLFFFRLHTLQLHKYKEIVYSKTFIQINFLGERVFFNKSEMKKCFSSGCVFTQTRDKKKYATMYARNFEKN